MQQDRHAELITLLDIVMIPEKGETAVDDFFVQLFKVLGYSRRERWRAAIPLFICGETRHAKTDVCIVDQPQYDILLFVQEGKRLENTEPVNARAQLEQRRSCTFNENNV
jgi:hypothetical protein